MGPTEDMQYRVEQAVEARKEGGSFQDHVQELL